MTVAALPSERILPNSINVGCDITTIHRGRADVLRAGGSEFSLDVTGMSTDDELVAAWIDIFAIPWRIHGIDSVISIGSDLGWIPGTGNFWVYITGIDDVPSAMLNSLSVAVPNIIDRMRSSGCNYTVAFAPSPRTDELLALVAAQNSRLAFLENDRRTNDTHPITTVDHRGPQPRIVGPTHHFDAFPMIANAVHLHCDTGLVRASRDALDPERDAFHLLDLTGAASQEHLLDRGGRAFDMPSPAGELSQLIPSETGDHRWAWRRFSVTLVTNVDDVPSPLLRQLVWLLAGRIDRIRALGEREAAMFLPTPRSDELVALLAAENQALDALGHATHGCIYPIAVIDHRRDGR